MEKVVSQQSRRLVLIGGSAGSLDVLFTLLPQLRNSSITYVIVLHRRHSDEGGLAGLLAAKTSFPVREVEDKDYIREGTVYLVPGDYHLLFEQDGGLSLDDSEKVAFSRPSIDVAMQSAVQVYGAAVTGVLLSGGNADGTDGLAAIKAAGGNTIAQMPATAQIPFMPQYAIDRGVVDHILSTGDMAAFLNGLS